MSSFSYSIKTALVLFPLVALVFTIPYILWQYHKYGSVNSYRSVIIYSFLLYMMTAYFLVILPLPSIEAVSKMKTPTYNLVPFRFISQILHQTTFQFSDFATYFPTMKNPYFYEAFFNVLLTLPFGVYLHYYFKCGFFKTLFYSFCFSIFFELTQITGLYFIYPRAYRIFDIDDIILNTTGGVIGFIIGILFLKVLPTRDDIDKKSLEKGKNVSVLRRIFSFMIDFFLFGTFFTCSIYLMKYYKLLNKQVFIIYLLIILLLYFVFLPKLLGDKTLGMKFLKLKFVSSYNQIKWYHYLWHFLLFAIEYFIFPFIGLLIGYTIYHFKIFDKTAWEYYAIVMLAITIMIYVITLLKWAFHSSTIYEKLSKITVKSTL